MSANNLEGGYNDTTTTKWLAFFWAAMLATYVGTLVAAKISDSQSTGNNSQVTPITAPAVPGPESK